MYQDLYLYHVWHWPPGSQGPPSCMSHMQKKHKKAFKLIEPEKDQEIWPQVQTCATSLEESVLSIIRFTRFFNFTSLVRGVGFLIHIAKSYKHLSQNDKCKGWHKYNQPHTPDETTQAKNIILKATQRAAFAKDLTTLRMNDAVHKNSMLQKLSPILENDLICVGAWLKHSHLPAAEKYPIILPKDSHISLLLTHHHHEQVKHQGCHLTEGAIRAARLWFLGGKALINSLIHKGVTCCKLRRKLEAGRTMHGRPATWAPQRLPSVFIRWTWCVWSLVYHYQTHQRGASREQTLGHQIQLHELCILRS